VREWPFLSHPKVPEEIKLSRVVLMPVGSPRTPLSPPMSSYDIQLVQMPGAQGTQAAVPWPLNTRELEEEAPAR